MNQIDGKRKVFFPIALWTGSLVLFTFACISARGVLFWSLCILAALYPSYFLTAMVLKRGGQIKKSKTPISARIVGSSVRSARYLVRLPKRVFVVPERFRRKSTSNLASQQRTQSTSLIVVSPNRKKGTHRFRVAAFVAIVLLAIPGFYYPPFFSVVVGVVSLYWIFRFTRWIIKENHDLLHIYSWRHFLLNSLLFPLYASPGVLMFAIAAVPVLAADVFLDFWINRLIAEAADAGSVVREYINTAPKSWNLFEYLQWKLTTWLITPRVSDQSSILVVGALNWARVISILLSLFTYSAIVVAMIRFLIEIWCRCLIASSGICVSFRLGEPTSNALGSKASYVTSCSVNEVVQIPAGTAFYSSTEMTPFGPKGHGAIPNMLTCTLARIRWGLFRLRRYRAIQSNEQLKYTGGGGVYFVQLKLQADQSLCINLAHVVGFSESIRLKFQWTGQLSAMLLGRLGFVIASGPGTIVMKAKGPPTLLRDYEQTTENLNNFTFACLLAWEPSSHFVIDGSGKFLDVYLEPTFMSVNESQLTLLNPGDSAHIGIFSKLKTWFLQSIAPV